ncbi:unnamed protein product [Prunus armeniaca]|uniref:Uncharacterized protein n=1 Tax=Prunus armeniaca TaxID=36596 RepID=A0A6J5TY59_PRUAR|nr:unnamed protein product [Prunus armeniaca]CAB4299360.1 unnamed protein product [Prunus armeniaca]
MRPAFWQFMQKEAIRPSKKHFGKRFFSKVSNSPFCVRQVILAGGRDCRASPFNFFHNPCRSAGVDLVSTGAWFSKMGSVRPWRVFGTEEVEVSYVQHGPCCSAKELGS